MPAPGSSFVGRGPERVRLVRVVVEERLVTLVGPPGVGKTRLAAEVARVAAEAFPDAACWIDLAQVTDADALVPAMARALGVHERSGHLLFGSLVSVMARQHLLLVLDNCEHLTVPVARVIGEMLEGSPRLHVLATSRQPLGSSRELVEKVAPFSVPETDDIHAVRASESGQLFVARAATVSPGFDLDGETAPAIANICRRLDGVALALELAAARTGVLSVNEIAAGLSDRFALLDGGPRPFPSRHETLAEALDWSHDLLSQAERVLLRRLGAFSGTPDFEAVVAVCAGPDLEPRSVLNVLANLVSKSLVEARTNLPMARYRLLETVRVYAGAQLEASGEADQVASAHARWCLSLAERADEHLTGPHQLDWLGVLDSQYDDIRSALNWLLAHERGDEALRLAASSALYWRLRGQHSEGHHWLGEALERCPEPSPTLRAKALWGAGFLAHMIGDHAASQGLLVESLELYRGLEDNRGCARALLLLGNRSLELDESGAATVVQLSESVALARGCDDSWCLAHALALMGRAHIQGGDLAAARDSLQEAIDVAGAATDTQGLRIALVVAGQLAGSRRDYRTAEVMLEAGVELCRRLKDSYGMYAALDSLAQVAAARGDLTRARGLSAAGLEMARSAGSPKDKASAISFLGRLAIDDGDLVTARRLLMEANGSARISPEIDLGLAELFLAEGQLEGAGPRLVAALSEAEASGQDRLVSRALYDLGNLARLQGHPVQAEARLCQALELRHEVGDARGVAESLEALAVLNAEASHAERAARLMGAAQALRELSKSARPGSQAPRHDAQVEGIRAALKPDAFEAAWGEGTVMAPGAAVLYALGTRGRRRDRKASGWESLTRGERQVAFLVAEGLTNRQIAARLFVSPLTVKGHVSKALAKLGLTSRVELANHVVRREVSPPDLSGPENSPPGG